MQDQYIAYETCFLQNKVKDLERLACWAQQEVTLEDLKNEAWLIAFDIERKRGYPVNFADVMDQDEVIGWLFIKHVKNADKKIRRAIRLDQDLENDHGGNVNHTLLNLLTAPTGSDPLQALLYREDITHRAAEIPPVAKSSYSEAAAYAVVMVRFEGSRINAAAYLAISVATLRKRHQRANDWIKIQSSLFDGIVFIELDFLPPQGRADWPKSETVYFDGMQAAWDFDKLLH